MFESLVDWAPNAIRNNCALSTFANKPDTIIGKQNNGRHTLSIRVKLEHLKPAIIPVLAKYGQTNQTIFFPMKDNSQPRF
jgi:hypothetical protein